MRIASAVLILLVIFGAVYALNITGFGTSDTPSNPATGIPVNPSAPDPLPPVPPR